MLYVKGRITEQNHRAPIRARQYATYESGATALEYSLIIGVIALVLVSVAPNLNSTMKTKFAEISESLTPTEDKNVVITNSKPTP